MILHDIHLLEKHYTESLAWVMIINYLLKRTFFSKYSKRLFTSWKKNSLF